MFQTNFKKSISAITCTILLLGGVSALNANTTLNSTEVNALQDRAVAFDQAKFDEYKKYYELAKQTLKGTKLGFVNDLLSLTDTINSIASAASGGNINFDIKTIPLRVTLASDTIRVIMDSAEKYEGSIYYKEQGVLTTFGFKLAAIILDTLNPFTKADALQNDIQKLQAAVSTAKAGATMSDSSVANSNIKEEFETELRAHRGYIFDNLLSVVNSVEIENYKNAVTKAVGLRLNPKATYGAVKAEIANLNNLKEAAKTAFSGLSDTNHIASLEEKEQFAVELRAARALKFNELKDKSYSINAKLDEVILKLTGVRLDPSATRADVKAAKLELQAAIDVAKSGQDEKAQENSRETLLKELHEARFMKFNVLSKKGWDVNVKLDSVIFSLNGTSINLFASQSEVENALAKLRAAVEEAKSAPDLW